MEYHPNKALVVGKCLTKVWGISGTERNYRLLAKVGISDVIYDIQDCKNFHNGTSQIILLNASIIIDAVTLKDFLSKRNSFLIMPYVGGYKIIAANIEYKEVSELVSITELMLRDKLTTSDIEKINIKIINTGELIEYFDSILSRYVKPIVLQIDESNVDGVERKLFNRTYDSITDIVTKYVWPYPSFYITKFLSKKIVIPNLLVWLNFLLIFISIICFALGYFINGLILAWLMSLLYTVGRSLAGVTINHSKLSEIIEHGIELVSPPILWIAWWYGVNDSSFIQVISIWALIGGYIIGKLIEQSFISSFGFKIHAWHEYDSYFRLITSQRNTNLLILSISIILLNPGLGIISISLWSILCLLFHIIRYIKAKKLYNDGVLINSWINK